MNRIAYVLTLFVLCVTALPKSPPPPTDDPASVVPFMSFSCESDLMKRVKLAGLMSSLSYCFLSNPESMWREALRMYAHLIAYAFCWTCPSI
jgi:hypothetical protein